MAGQTNAGNSYQRPLVLPTGPAISSGKQPIFLIRIYDLLERHLPDPSVRVNWLAVQLAINRKTLYRKVQRLIQLTPTDLIRQYRLHKAVELLRIDRTVTQTANLIGLKTASHFASVFKEFYPQTLTGLIAGQKKKA